MRRVRRPTLGLRGMAKAHLWILVLLTSSILFVMLWGEFTAYPWTSFFAAFPLFAFGTNLAFLPPNEIGFAVGTFLQGHSSDWIAYSVAAGADIGGALCLGFLLDRIRARHAAGSIAA